MFWRCPPPELRIPLITLGSHSRCSRHNCGIGPHGSTTPQATLRKLEADLVMVGEPEELLAELTGNWDRLDSLCYRRDKGKIVTGAPHYADMQKLAGFAMGAG